MKYLHNVSAVWLLLASVVQCALLEVIQAATPPRRDLSRPTCRQQVFSHDFGSSYGAPYVGYYSAPSSSSSSFSSSPSSSSPDSECRYTTTIFNLSVVCAGRQYDRLATLWLGDVEVWRTSTAMPSQSGIHWSFQKDMTIWDTLLRGENRAEGEEEGDGKAQQKQKIIFELNNNVDGDRYTGIFNVTLEALFFDDVYEGSADQDRDSSIVSDNSNDDDNKSKSKNKNENENRNGLTPASHIYALSTRSSSLNQTSLFSLSGAATVVGVTNLTLPRNSATAIVSITASGNAAEEFWFTNVPSEYATATFPGNEGWLYGYGPFREVQLLIDTNTNSNSSDSDFDSASDKGEMLLAGVCWPFPILFTGGVDPGAWRPIVGIDAYELPSCEVDITPFLGLLTDGREHRFGLRVVGYDSFAPDKLGPVGENWWVSGSVFVWVDENEDEDEESEKNTSTSEKIEQTTAKDFKIEAPPPEFHFQPILGTHVAENGSVTNTSFYFSLTATRSLRISSTLTGGGLNSSNSRHVFWSQDVSYSNIQNMTDLAFNQSLSMVSSGRWSSSATATAPYHPNNIVTSTYSYPMNLFSAYKVQSEGSTSNPGSVLCLVDRSKLTDGISSLLAYLTGTSTGPATLRTRQNVTSEYHWNRTIVEGTPGLDTMEGETWFSSSSSPGSKHGVRAYHRYAKEKDDVLVADRQGWDTIPVPSTLPLPVVEGEPHV